MAKAAIALSAKDFKHVISIASLAVERRTSIPILSMLRCKANGAFEVSGTDLDVLVTARVDHGGGPSGEFMLPQPRSLADAVVAGGSGGLTLARRSDGKIQLTSGPLCLTVDRPVAPEDFPTDAGMEAETFSASLSMAQVRSLGRIAAAVSTEETRYYLNGIYIHHVAGQTYRAAATDGHRLCFVDLELPDAKGDLPGVILPRKSLRMMLHLSGKPSPHDEGVLLAVGHRNLPNRETSTAPEKVAGPTRASFGFRVGGADVHVSTKLIDGTFPDYGRVVPPASDNTKLFTFDAAELRRAIEALRHCATGKVRALRLAFDAEGAAISGCYAESGISSAMRVACDHRWAGFEVGFNGGYLLSMLEAAGPGEIILATEDAASPALIRNPADTAWTGVLMPMRV